MKLLLVPMRVSMPMLSFRALGTLGALGALGAVASASFLLVVPFPMALSFVSRQVSVETRALVVIPALLFSLVTQQSGAASASTFDQCLSLFLFL